MPSDLDRAAIVRGEAFAEYAWTRWTVDAVDHQSRITGVQRLTLEHLGLAFGEVWVTTCNGIIESVALWTDSAASKEPNRWFVDRRAVLLGSSHKPGGFRMLANGSRRQGAAGFGWMKH